MFNINKIIILIIEIIYFRFIIDYLNRNQINYLFIEKENSYQHRMAM